MESGNCVNTINLRDPRFYLGVGALRSFESDGNDNLATQTVK